MAYNQNKLKRAIAYGFIPLEFIHYTGGELYVLSKIDQQRVGVCYKVKTEDSVIKYVHWYTADEIDEMLNETN